MRPGAGSLVAVIQDYRRAARKHPVVTAEPTPAFHPRVHLQDFQAFACTNCGRCCKPWVVSIDPHQTVAIESSQAYGHRMKPDYTPLRVMEGGRASLGDRGDNSCTFLDDQQLCSVHSELGARLKPLGCQLYPYQPVHTPDGIYLSLSFGCPPVVAGLDLDVEANRQDLAVALAYHTLSPPDTESSPFLIKLTADRPISWRSYLNLERRVLAAYSAVEPLDSILRLVLSILRARPGGEDWPDLATREDTSFPRELYAKYLGSLVSTVEILTDPAMREDFAPALAVREEIPGDRSAMALPALVLDHPLDEWALGTYERYFRNAVLGKSLLKGTVVSKLLATASAMVLAGHFAQALHARRGSGEEVWHLDCWTEAFRLVECDIITHTDASDLYVIGLEETFIKLAEFPLEELP